MYEAFYGLNEKPFNLTPDPRFLYLSVKHKEAFAHLLYGIQNRAGFVMVSGEIGTGKTTICRSLLKELDADTEVAFIFNPKLSPDDLLRTIIGDFGIPSHAETVPRLIDELNAYLLKSTAAGKNCVLIIDEAQNLGTDTLEQVRLLSNLETETQKLLQIVLIGQPELAAKLALPELRQLNQRITARYHLQALNEEETLHYIAFRLRVAGGRRRVRFTRPAVSTVFRRSRGTPRVINAICDRALLIGYTKEARQITPRLVNQAAREIKGDRRSLGPKPRRGRLLTASAFAALGAVAIVAVLLLTSGPLPTLDEVGDYARSQWERLASPIEDAPQDLVARADDPPGFESAAGAMLMGDPSGVDQAIGAPGLLATAPAPASRGGPDRLGASNVAEAASLGAKPEEKLEPEPAEETEPVIVAAKVPAGDSGTSVAPPVRADELVDVLAGPTGTAPLSAILRVWNMAVLTDLPSELSVESIREFGRANGLASARHMATIDQVVAINLPVLLKVEGNSGEEWVALLMVKEGEAHIATTGSGSLRVPVAWLDNVYLGEAVYLWADPSPGAKNVSARSIGEAVRALQSDLRSLRLLEDAPSGAYDRRTEVRITQIQAATGLLVDGIVGPRTRMVLSSWLARTSTPTLSGEPFPEAVRARVLASPPIVLSAVDVPEPVHAVVSAVPEAAAEEYAPVPDSGVASTQDLSGARSDGGAESAPVPRDTGLEERDRAADPTSISYGMNGDSVDMEELGAPLYVPQLESGAPVLERGVTPSAGRIVPIIPSNSSVGER